MKLHIIDEYKSIFPELKGRALTDAMIRRCLGRDDIGICRTQKGKPYVLNADGSSGPYISVSHSGSVFALVEADREIGLDIQYARSVKKEKIAARYFAPEEAEAVAGDETGEQFFRLWTRKEAYSKYTGAGMEQIMKKELLRTDEVRFTDIRLKDGCFCAICTGREEGDQSDEIQISYGE